MIFKFNYLVPPKNDYIIPTQTNLNKLQSVQKCHKHTEIDKKNRMQLARKKNKVIPMNDSKTSLPDTVVSDDSLKENHISSSEPSNLSHLIPIKSHRHEYSLFRFFSCPLRRSLNPHINNSNSDETISRPN